MISYRPGTWFGIVGEHATVLLPPSEKARAGSLWVLIDDGAGFDEVLDALLADGLRALPGFVLLTEEGSTTRIVVRGPSRATFDTLGGEAVVEGSASATWVEKTLRDVTGLSVVLEESDEPLMALNSGLVRVASLVSPMPAAGPAAPAAPAAPITTAPAPAPIQLAPQPEASGPYAAVLPFPAGVPAPPVVPPPPSFPAPPAADPLGLDPDPLGLGDLGAPSEPEHAPEPAPEPQGEPEPEDTDESSDELDVPEWLASSDPLTDQAEDYQEAEERAEDDEAWADEPTGVLPVVPAADADEPTGPITAAPPAWTPPAPSAPGDGLPASVPPPPPFPPVPPIAEAAPVPPAPLAPPAPQGGHDGLTPVGEPELEQPSVPAAAEQSVARLEFAHGERVDVDRVVIVGRAPEAGRFSQAEQPRLVAVPSPHQEISSTHIEIRPGSGVDHGSAVVTDLGSTNGTVVVQPGLGPEELRPGVPVPLTPGAMIDLGDGMTIRVTQP
ncbi:FHA domain-containing protein [Nocardioides nematodiphilus]|uniref:FHA domain-containing protein n=1 Tax=Nocardioides nematodiphilus TaxID=2849669 RepID=UPI0027E1EDA7|nr:FHA domain-containing protein [Nocardioides nematodiphilus]